MKTVFALVLLTSSVAAASDRLEKLRASAETLNGLGPFLQRYVGDCESAAMGGGECLANAKAFRQKATGQRYYMALSDEAAGMIALGAQKPNGEFTLHVTPFFPADSFAITHGAPTRTDANGNPVLPFLYVKGALAPESLDSISRLVSMRGLRLHVVFRPQAVWSLKGKGKAKLQGVKAKVEGIVVTISRTDEQVAAWP